MMRRRISNDRPRGERNLEPRVLTIPNMMWRHARPKRVLKICAEDRMCSRHVREKALWTSTVSMANVAITTIESTQHRLRTSLAENTGKRVNLPSQGAVLSAVRLPFGDIRSKYGLSFVVGKSC